MLKKILRKLIFILFIGVSVSCFLYSAENPTVTPSQVYLKYVVTSKIIPTFSLTDINVTSVTTSISRVSAREVAASGSENSLLGSSGEIVFDVVDKSVFNSAIDSSPYLLSVSSTNWTRYPHTDSDADSLVTDSKVNISFIPTPNSKMSIIASTTPSSDPNKGNIGNLQITFLGGNYLDHSGTGVKIASMKADWAEVEQTLEGNYYICLNVGVTTL